MAQSDLTDFMTTAGARASNPPTALDVAQGKTSAPQIRASSAQSSRVSPGGGSMSPRQQSQSAAALKSRPPISRGRVNFKAIARSNQKSSPGLTRGGLIKGRRNMFGQSKSLASLGSRRGKSQYNA